MRSLVGFVLFLALLGAFIAPPYNYTYEERLLLKHKPPKWDFLYWPLRAYENWENCGTIGYCTKTRCDALEGGCFDAVDARIEKLTKNYKAPLQQKGETAAAWKGRVKA